MQDVQREEDRVECAAEAQASPPAAAPAPPHAFPPAAAAALPEPSTCQAGVPAQPTPPASSAGKVEPGQHLLRHALTPEIAAAATAEFGMDQSAAGLHIWELK